MLLASSGGKALHLLTTDKELRPMRRTARGLRVCHLPLLQPPPSPPHPPPLPPNAILPLTPPLTPLLIHILPLYMSCSPSTGCHLLRHFDFLSKSRVMR